MLKAKLCCMVYCNILKISNNVYTSDPYTIYLLHWTPIGYRDVFNICISTIEHSIQQWFSVFAGMRIHTICIQHPLISYYNDKPFSPLDKSTTLKYSFINGSGILPCKGRLQVDIIFVYQRMALIVLVYAKAKYQTNSGMTIPAN